jgi:sugar phosphate isomerase/epimerase
MRPQDISRKKKMVQLSIFPKFLQSLSPVELATQLSDIGLDACNVVIRSGYWCDTDNLSHTLPHFTQAMRRSGLTCNFATWALPPEQLLEHEDDLQCLADHGLTGFRMGYFNQGAQESYPAAIARARNTMAAMAELCERVGLRGVYQVHHGRLVTGPESASFICEGLSSNHVSVMLDVGNQGHEGGCDWLRAERLLGEQWTHLGVKDLHIVNRNRIWCPCHAGITDFQHVLRGWQQRHRPGTWVLMPFYHQDDINAHLQTLRQEVSWLREQIQLAEN